MIIDELIGMKLLEQYLRGPHEGSIAEAFGFTEDDDLGIRNVAKGKYTNEADEALALFTRRLNDLLQADPARRREHLLAVMPGSDAMRLHPFAAHVMTLGGVDDVDAAALSLWAKHSVRFALPGDDHGVLTYFEPEGDTRITLHLAGGVEWDDKDRLPGHSVRVAIAIPDTVEALVGGRRLSDVVEHPLLDRYPLVIRHAYRVRPDATIFELEDVDEEWLAQAQANPG